MNKIKVEKTKLLQTLKQNLDKHLSEYHTALAAYRKAYIENLQKKISDVEAGGKPDHQISLAVPVSYEGDYDTAITALEYSVDQYIELTLEEIDNYLRDEWTWKRSFTASNLSYHQTR